MTDMPVWVEAAVNDERRRLRENSRLEVLAERVDAKIESPSRTIRHENAGNPRYCGFPGIHRSARRGSTAPARAVSCCDSKWAATC